MKYLILGHKEHGKTTAADILKEEYHLEFKDSSMEAAKIFIYDLLAPKYGYKTFEECYTDRRNRRKEWYDLITEYNTPNKSRLAEKILEHNDMYVGMRDPHEIQACNNKNLFDLVIGIYDPRKEEEGKDSFAIDLFKECHVVIYNNSDINDLRNKLITLFDAIYKVKTKHFE